MDPKVAMKRTIADTAKNRSGQTATGLGLRTSALISTGPAFLDPSLDTSVVASRTLGTKLLGGHLDAVLKDYSPDDAMPSLEQAVADMSKGFTNCRLDPKYASPWEWEDDANLIAIAAVCSKAVYKPKNLPTLPGFEFELVDEIEKSKNGNIKSTAITCAREKENSGSEVFIISVKGTKGLLEKMILLNHEPREAGDFLPLEHQTVSVHAGFLMCAKELCHPKHAKNVINTILSLPTGSRLLLTGHSAGGAVAALIFAHVLLKSTQKDSPLANKQLRLSLITFGAPPILDPDLTSTLSQITYPVGTVNRVLAFVLEGDPIPRADEPYISCLLELYRYVAQKRPEIDVDTLSRGDFGHWTVPRSRWSILGYLKVFRDENEYTERKGSDFWLYSVSQDRFKELLYSDMSMHRMSAYLTVALQLLSGEVNNHSGFSDE